MPKHLNAKAILYLSYDGLTDQLGRSQILPYLTGLALMGYKITIISFEKENRFSSAGQSIRETCNRSGIKWNPLTYHKDPPVLSTLYDMHALSRACKKLIAVENFHIVHCRSYITAIVGLSLKKKYGLKLIFDMRGFWADERVESGIWNQHNPVFKQIYKYFKRKERQLLHFADHVIVLTEAAKIEILTWKVTHKITTIPCCVDLQLFDPSHFDSMDRRELRDQLGIAPDDFVLLYLGSLGTWYLLEEMLLFFEKVKEQRPGAKFLILTPDRDVVESSQDIIVKTVDRSMVPRYIMMCDASVCFIKPTFSKTGSSATKMAEVLAMNIPVATNPGWGDIEYLSNHVNGLFIISNDHQIPHKFFEKGACSRHEPFFFDFFSLTKGIETYHKVYQSMLP